MPPAQTGHNPALYPFTGPGYFGEYSGYVYDPYADAYRPDPKVQQEYYESQGLIEPKEEVKQPGLTDMIVPLAVASAVPTLAQQAAQGLGGLIGGSTAGTGSGLTAAGEGIFSAIEAGNPILTEAGTTIMGTGGGMATGGGPASAGLLSGGEGLGGLTIGGVPAIPAAGVVGGLLLGAKGVKDLVNDKPTKGLEGWGGRVTLGIATGGISELIRGSGLFRKSRTKQEDKRLENIAKSLEEQGVDPAQFITEYDKGLDLTQEGADKQLKKSIEQTGLPEDFQGWKNGQFINHRWLKSGDEKDLTGIDVAGSAAVLENLLANGLITPNMSPLDIMKAKFDYADRAVASGAVNEHHGTIDIDSSKLNDIGEGFTPTSWDQFKFNTSLQSVQEQGVPWQQELQRRRELEPEWTDWNAIEQQLLQQENNQNG